MARYSSLLICSKLLPKKIIPVREYKCSCFYSSHTSYIEQGVISRNNVQTNKLFYRTVRFSINKSDTEIVETSRKLLKVAIVGVPNSGKSTLINQIVGRHIFPASSKVHTTRCRARAVIVVENTQLIFLDTPGIVGVQEGIKHHLERACLVDSEEAIKEADIVGVIHDVSNKHTIFKLDPKVLRHLILYPRKPSFLILNKVDAMKTKRDLLNCVKLLTKGHDVVEEKIEDINSFRFADTFRLDEYGRSRFTESELQNVLLDQTGWPYFKKIFMVSALTGSGVGDIQMYLMEEAKPGEWLFDRTVITDQNEMDIVEKTVFSKLLDHLPNVIPYNLDIQLDYLEKSVDGSVTAVVMIIAKKAQIKNLIKGKGGERIKKIAVGVEQCLRSFYLNDVHIRLIILDRETDKIPKREEDAGTVAVFSPQ